MYYQIDLERMPLGRLSMKQISQAYDVLSEAIKVDFGNILK